MATNGLGQFRIFFFPLSYICLYAYLCVRARTRARASMCVEVWVRVCLCVFLNDFVLYSRGFPEPRKHGIIQNWGYSSKKIYQESIFLNLVCHGDMTLFECGVYEYVCGSNRYTYYVFFFIKKNNSKKSVYFFN